MYKFHIGDLVASIHPSSSIILKTGLVVNSDKRTFKIKWMSFNHDFFMEKQGDIFKELNNRYLLGTVEINRNNVEPFLVLLNSNYCDGKLRRNKKKT
tara:strand:+ start:3191 stop:3481 length:291 start_codon:yes stop_codon:yes gene_type:complete